VTARESGIANREQGTESRERGTGNGEPVTRRNFVAAGAAGVASVVLGKSTSLSPHSPLGSRFPIPRSRSVRSVSRPLKQSAARWCYDKIPLREFAQAAKRIGLAGIDLLQPSDWEIVREYGLTCSMGYPTERRDFLTVGFNDRANHAMLLRELERTIPLAARHEVPNVIAMFGNRGGRSDDAAIAASIEGLSKIKPLAEQHQVTVCVELLNSKVDHRDYQGDRTAFGVEVMKGVGSPRVKLLYDIYHMQIMEGDVIRTIRDNIAHIGHFHTGGVPGRHELDAKQELNWRAIAMAIADTPFTGFVAHEFMPTGDPLTSLKAAFEVFAV
jgi:hydroxypyruvate isomerase